MHGSAQLPNICGAQPIAQLVLYKTCQTQALHSWYCIRNVRHRWQHQVIHGSAQLPNSIPEVLGSCDGAQTRLQHCSCESPKGACSVVAHLARGPGVLIDLLLLRTAMMLGLSSLLGGDKAFWPLLPPCWAGCTLDAYAALPLPSIAASPTLPLYMGEAKDPTLSPIDV